MGLRSEQRSPSERYPKAVWFILGNEFCERFNFYGCRAVLVLFLMQYLGWSADSATAGYHGFIMLAYLTPVLGAILADGVLGKFRTILYLSLVSEGAMGRPAVTPHPPPQVYIAGNAVLSGTAVPGATGPRASPSAWGAMLGLGLIALGTGGIKPCVASFGGQQLGSAALLEGFFSLFYFSINAGSFISTIVTPILRADVQCFGRTDCYPLAFGVPGCLMVIATLVFVAGGRVAPGYRHDKPERNVTKDAAIAIGIGIRAKCRRNRGVSAPEHWLDSAAPRVGAAFVEDLKAAMRVLYLFIPLPIFWALFDQSGSRWTVQAGELEAATLGELGDFKPDQMQSVNSVLVLMLVPLFHRVVYPAARRCGLPCRPLNKMALGMLLSGLSFVAAGLLQVSIDGAAQAQAPSAARGASRLQVISLLETGVDVAVVVPEAALPHMAGNGTLPAGGTLAGQGLSFAAADGIEVQLAQQGTIFMGDFASGAAYMSAAYPTDDGGSAALLRCQFVFSVPGGGAVAETANFVVINARAGAVTASPDSGGEAVGAEALGCSAAGSVQAGGDSVAVTDAESGDQVAVLPLNLPAGAWAVVAVGPDAAGGGAAAAATHVVTGGNSISCVLPLAPPRPQPGADAPPAEFCGSCRSTSSSLRARYSSASRGSSLHSPRRRMP